MGRCVDVAQHSRGNVDSEDIIGIGEETDTGNAHDLDVEPTMDVTLAPKFGSGMLGVYARELGVVNFGKGGTPALVKVDGTLGADVGVLFLERLRGGHGRRGGAERR